VTDFPTSNTRPRKRKPQFNGAWLVLGGLIVLVGSAWFAGTQDFVHVRGTASVPLDLLRAVGIGIAGGLAIAVGVWLLLHLFAGGRHEPGKAALRLGILAVVAIFIAIPVSGIRVMSDAFHDEEAALQEIRFDSEDRIEAHLTRIYDERERIIAGGFMEPYALSEPGGVARARRKIVALRALIRQADADTAGLGAQARAEIDTLPVSAARRRMMKQEFDRGFESARKEGAEEVELAGLLFDEMEAQLDILSRAPGTWGQQGEGIGFARQRDLNDFNARALRIQEIVGVIEARDRERERRRSAERAHRRIVSHRP
jgi:hypothetical protein